MHRRRSAAPDPQHLDVAIIGAGAAGLACAHELLRRGCGRVQILEARDRIGGRVQTTRFSGLDLPIELGAEFIHGAAPQTYSIADDLGLVYAGSSESHLLAHGSGATLRQAEESSDLFQRMGRLFAKLNPQRKPDRSVAAFLEAHQRTAGAPTVALARAFVEGFQAADVQLMGERGLALEEGASDEADATEASRFTAGYAVFMDGLLARLEGSRALVRLGSVVNAVKWREGQIQLTVRSSLGVKLRPVIADKLVVTAPIGVLKAPAGAAGAIDFQPPLPGYSSALAGVEMGHAMRIAFHFRSRFWETLAPAGKTLGYLHAGAGTDFPTWWTALPVRAPVLTAWQGGPRAAQLSLQPEAARVDAALATLSRLLGCERATIDAQLQGWKTHDWTQDPFSLGGYSYVGVGGSAGAQRLSKPFSQTVYFAGEGTCNDSTRGTVEGAIQSGIRAARQVLARPRG